LSNVLITLLEIHILKAPDQEDSLALTQMDRLYDKCLIVLFLIELGSEIIHLLGENPGFREKVKLSWEYFVHPHKVSGQVVLPGQLVHPWVMIDALVRH
jgi:hypothetical protein